MSESGNLATKSSDKKGCSEVPCSALVKAVVHWETTGDMYRPVHILYNNGYCKTQKLANPKNNSRTLQRDSGYHYNHKLTYLFLALCQQRKCRSERVWFATINLSMQQSFNLRKSTNKPPLRLYMDRLNKAVKRATGKIMECIAVLEHSRDGSLHVHLVVLATEREIELLRPIYRKHAAKQDNSVQVKDYYLAKIPKPQFDD